MKQIEKIIDGFEAIGSRVYLVTLPGLFSTKEKPSLKALKIGHLPTFTENPYVLATITEKFNQTLRALSLQRNLGLIDLEKWGMINLHPKDQYFTDSVHLNAKGLEKIGAFLADKLKPIIRSHY
ncbi:MAG: hypothetical protein ISR52_01040 [Rhodospirillales bacterium]|nr:hypothetical protein [Rhodospirillales bacterium]